MRRIVVCLIVAVAALAMSGCRTDSVKPSTSQTEQNTEREGRDPAPALPGQGRGAGTIGQAADDRPLLVCFGDSLTAGYGADEGNSYPDFLQKDLDAAGYHYRVVNEGISGNTTKDGVDRLSQIEDMHPAVVVLEFGGNDGLRGLNVQTTRQNLGKMIAGLRSGGAKVLLAGITLPPDYGRDYVNAFTSNYAALGRQYRVAVLPFLLKDVYGVPGMMQADNIHATNRGNEVVARNTLVKVQPLLKK